MCQVCFVRTDRVMIRCMVAYHRSRRVPLSENVHMLNRFIDR